jgi:hypothetical protein
MTRETNIPAQGLGPALELLAREFDVQIVFVSEDINHLHTQGAIGKFTPEQALKQLLIGTGRTFKYLDEKTVTIVPVVPNAEPIAYSRTSGTDDLRVAQEQNSATGKQSVSNAPPAPAVRREDTPHEALGEIIVTATKRAENRHEQLCRPAEDAAPPQGTDFIGLGKQRPDHGRANAQIAERCLAKCTGESLRGSGS